MAEPEVFHIHSTVRDVSNRTQRAAAPGRMRFKNYLGGGMLRLIRKRPTIVTKDVVVKLRAELIEKEKQGILKVALPDGRRIDLETLKPIDPKAPPVPKPAPPLDSAARDKTFPAGVGEHMEQLPGGVPQAAALDIPAALKDIPDGVEPPDGPSVLEEDDDEDDGDTSSPKKKSKKTARGSRGR